MTDAPPYREAPTFATWKAEDAHIHIELWNSMEPQISSSLVYIYTAKQVWISLRRCFLALVIAAHL